MESISDGINSGRNQFRIESVPDGINSGWNQFRMESIPDGISSGWNQFRMESHDFNLELESTLKLVEPPKPTDDAIMINFVL